MDANHLLTHYTLPCGVTVKNRLVKAAMTERVSNRRLAPNAQHFRLYDRWANSGAGLLISGNVMVDPVHREAAGNVYLGRDTELDSFTKWAATVTRHDTHFWVQLNHAGRQTNRFMTHRPLAPSVVQLNKMGLFGRPRAMSEHDIETVIANFVTAAQQCQRAGFTGIQIHAAHGYLLSQFLSPKTNRRQDKWGGSVENRSRLLLTIVAETRKAVGAAFPISVKLNSSDFQRGGFTEEASLQVIQMLEGEIDLLEISGGTYERAVFFELNESRADVRQSTKQREAYFITFAHKVRAVSSLPLMITGGFRSFDFCNAALANGELDFIGMARPFITNLEEMPAFLDNRIEKLENLVVRTGIKSLNDSAELGYYARQLVRLANDKPVDLKTRPLLSSVALVSAELGKALVSRRHS